MHTQIIAGPRGPLSIGTIVPLALRTLVTPGVELDELHSTGSLADAWRSASARLGERER